MTIERLQYDRQSGQMLASGVVEYTTGGESVTQDFRRVPVDVTDGSSGDMSTMSSHGCEILNLDLGPIFLDLLGLQLDLSPVDQLLDGLTRLLNQLLRGLGGLSLA